MYAKIRTGHFCYAGLLSVLLILSACGGSSGGSSGNQVPPPPVPEPTDTVPVDELPLLPPGAHVSMIKGFNGAQPEETDQAMAARWAEALEAGMQVGRIQVDWAELEPAPGVFAESAILPQLEALQQDGLSAFVLLSTIDSEGYTLPPDLSDADDSTMLAEGLSIDGDTISRRFNALLDWLVPQMVAHGAWVLAVGNEPGPLIENEPEQGDQLVNFLKQARERVRAIEPRLAVTMTLNYEMMQLASSRHADFIAHSDVASFNYYGSSATGMSEQHDNVINHELTDMLSVASGKQVIFQELGAAAGYDDRPSLTGGTTQSQRAFFDTVFMRMRDEPRLRVAVIFQLVDWDPDLVDELYTQPLLAAGVEADFAARFAESLNTLGLIRFRDGSSRPAWQRVLGEISYLNP